MPPIPDLCCLVAHEYSLVGDAEPMLITYGVEFEGDIPPGQDVVNDLDAGWKANMNDMADLSYTLVRTTIWLRNGGVDPEVWVSDNAPAVGTVTGRAFPPNTSALVTKTSGFAGRRNRGRMFIPGVISEAASEQGVLDAGALVAYQAILTAWFEHIDAPPVIPGDEGRYLVILHSEATHWELVGGQPRRVGNGTAIPPPTRVTGLQLEARVATQRRRLRP